MTEQIFRVKTSDEQISVFCSFAEKYKSDFDSEKLSQFKDMPLRQVFDFVVNSYILEEDEQIFRPLAYVRLAESTGKAGDCDDGFIFWASLLRSVGISENLILVCEAKDKVSDESYGHIFCALQTRHKIIWLDNLPGCKFGRLDYPANRLKVSKFSDYL